MIRSRFFAFVGFTFFLYTRIFAQDSSEEDSIVYIYEPPVVVKKQIKHEVKVYNQWFLETGGAFFLHKNKHCDCESIAAYRADFQNSVKPSLGNGWSARVRYMPKKSKTTFSLGLSTTSFRENFKHSLDTLGNTLEAKNRYHYVDLSIGMGYWMNRKHKMVSVIANAEVLISGLVSSKGYTLDYLDPSVVLSNKEANRDAKWVVGGVASLKTLFFNNSRVKLYLEPYLRMNITSVLEYRTNYFLQRWSYGSRIGLLYVL